MAMRFDAIVIGAGQSGPSLAVRLANAGMKVALVERRTLGGTCVNDGCIPTKTLIASARAAWVRSQRRDVRRVHRRRSDGGHAAREGAQGHAHPTVSELLPTALQQLEPLT
jgi:pyruvate/2-oxoglutarate dehydrogenase complex dihydrolipoamide dehydrogenase (E3) component